MDEIFGDIPNWYRVKTVDRNATPEMFNNNGNVPYQQEHACGVYYVSLAEYTPQRRSIVRLKVIYSVAEYTA